MIDISSKLHLRERLASSCYTYTLSSLGILVSGIALIVIMQQGIAGKISTPKIGKLTVEFGFTTLVCGPIAQNLAIQQTTTAAALIEKDARALLDTKLHAFSLPPSSLGSVNSLYCSFSAIINHVVDAVKDLKKNEFNPIITESKDAADQTLQQLKYLSVLFAVAAITFIVLGILNISKVLTEKQLGYGLLVANVSYISAGLLGSGYIIQNLLHSKNSIMMKVQSATSFSPSSF